MKDSKDSGTTFDTRPINTQTGEPIGPLAQPGYYPSFSTLAQKDFWDAATRNSILERINNVPPFRFFNEEQANLLQAVCNQILPQDDRDQSHKIPIAEFIDNRLFLNHHDGYRYEDMPPDREAYLWGLQGIDESAKASFGLGFTDLGPLERDQVLASLHSGNPLGGQEVWDKMPVHRFWTLLVSDCTTTYYSHPYAWDEIGFGGPSYPRGYMRLENGLPEPWEQDEVRYEWQAPLSSVSDSYRMIAGREDHHGAPE